VESFIDTFCIHTRQATWRTTINKRKWADFLNQEYGVSEKKYGNYIYNFDQIERKAFFIHPSLGIPLRDLRQKFHLKSTFFSSYLNGDQVVLEGRGFGHGVGLCQEGAMRMAELGYGYSQIARFYFHNVQVIDFQHGRSLIPKAFGR
jgi:stage II sporulation protein D